MRQKGTVRLNRSNPPRIAVVFLHPGCNMTCAFCVTENTIDIMDYAQAVRMLHAIRERGMDSVVLGGGEPFTWPHDVVPLTAEAKDLGFHVQVGTNGVALPDGYERIESIDRYVLPLDAAGSEAHNRLRCYQDGHHQVILDRLMRLRDARKAVTVSTVVNAWNIDALPEIAAFLQTYQASGGTIHAWHLYKFIPQGRGGAEHADSLDISEQAYHAACDHVRATNPGFDVFKRRDMFHSRTVDFFWYEDGRIVVGSEVWERRADSEVRSAAHTALL